ncbi:MAG: PQQ-binding-like beta-propeller repeat protein [Candidatus Bathyarchaeota archaeon]|nr:PQQ-binding-like beta-propeller repeat protein [Candidatus Bathyarchaeota archaeon]
MKKETSKKKMMRIAIAILLMLSMAVSVPLISVANAASYPTYSFISVSPNPIGKGQTVNVNFWVNVPVGGFSNITVKVTKPGGTTDTLGPFTADLTGGAYTTYIPNTVGNYTFQMSFAGQTIGGSYWEPSSSNVFTLTVQEEPIGYPPETPLPTKYWTRPIYAENNNWYLIAGNWLSLCGNVLSEPGLYNSSGNYNPYTTAPNSGHILWTKPLAFGGMIGGEYGNTQTSNFASTVQDESKFMPIIMNGVIYQTMVPGSAANPAGWQAVDLRTGQTLWTKNTTDYLLCGQILNVVTPQQYGATAFLWSNPLAPVPGIPPFQINYVGSDLHLNDAMTGNYILTITNGPGGYHTGGMTIDEQGDLIFYYVNATDNTLNMWNSTECIRAQWPFPISLFTQFWRTPQNAVLDFGPGIEWSVPLANNVSGVPLNPPGLSIAGIGSDVILMTQYKAVAGFTQSGWQVEAGYSAVDGRQLWITNRTQTPGSIVLGGSNPSNSFTMSRGVYVEITQSTFKISGYSQTTGQQIWGPVTLPDPNPFSSLGMAAQAANDTIYIIGYGGDCWAYNILTGEFKWHYKTPSSIESPYGVFPFWTYPMSTVADGKIFIAEGHEYSPPLFHGAKEVVLNITDGSLIWSISGFYVQTPAAISDGIMATSNSYDNQIYAFGKGPTKVTVNAPIVGVTTSTPITISGTVTDISAGASQQAVAANFPNGLPCVSDASMSQFMEAVYMQQPMPNNVTGVPISIDVLDANGNYRNIGTTTSDASGAFGFTWTPDIPGDYKVIATFVGSESYYGSSAVTYFHASEAPSVTPVPTPVPQAPVETYFTVSTIAIIAAIAIAVVLLFRKK